MLRAMPAKTGLLFTLRLIPPISTMLARRGIDVAPLLTTAGVPLEAMRGEITAPLSRVQAFMHTAATALGTERFGIELAAAVPSGSYGIAEFLARSAATLGDGLRVLCEFAPLINPISNMQFAVGADGVGRFHYAVGSERDMLGMHLNEFSIAYLVNQFSLVQGARVPLESAWFAHARPGRADAVAQHFGCSVRFQAPDCGFSLAPAVVAMPIRTAEPVLFKFLLEQARTQLARSGELDIVTHLVRVLETRLRTGALGADEVARSMALTSRTLQRQLAGAGTTYRDVLAHVRARRRAELAGRGMTELAIAKQLGFSDVRAMRRSLD